MNTVPLDIAARRAGITPQLQRPPLSIISPAQWEGIQPPPYNWIVEGCFLPGTVSMLSGDGGLGKSLLMQQLCTAASIGKTWLGLDTKRCRTMAVFCEDDAAELHRRQEHINRHYDCSMGDLENVLYIERAGQENAIMEFEKWGEKFKTTSFYESLCDEARGFGAEIIVLDTVADVFSGNEIARTQVRRFISHLRRLAIDCQASLILTAHPSNTGLSSGTGISGSTAWNNSVRSRLYLTAKVGDADGDGSDPERLLKTMKNNHGPYGGKIGLRWEEGVFVRCDGGGLTGNIVDRLTIDTAVLSSLRYLVEQGTMVLSDPTSKTGLANLAIRTQQAKGLSWSAVTYATDRLVADGKAVRVELGPMSKRRLFIRPVDMKYAGE